MTDYGLASSVWTSIEDGAEGLGPAAVRAASG